MPFCILSNEKLNLPEPNEQLHRYRLVSSVFCILSSHLSVTAIGEKCEAVAIGRAC